MGAFESMHTSRFTNDWLVDFCFTSNIDLYLLNRLHVLSSHAFSSITALLESTKGDEWPMKVFS